MKKYKSRSFVEGKDYNKYEAIGNGATIFILDENEIFNKEEMSEISKKEDNPITCFVKNIKDNKYDVFFYNIDGTQAYMCGHGLLCTSDILNKEFNLKNLEFYYDKSRFKDKEIDNLVEVYVSDKSFMKTNVFHYNVIKDYDENINLLINYLGIEKEDIVDIICGKEYYDLTFVLKDSDILRKLKPNFKDMTIILNEEHMNVRNLCVTSKSKEVDFETRVFFPHNNVDEDIVCGSSNLIISSYWKDITNKSEFKILFPYHFNDDDKIGGVQFIKITENKILLGGYCR